MKFVKPLFRCSALCGAALLILSAQNAFADTEPNNTLATANELIMGENMPGTLNVDPGDVSDWYAVTTAVNGVFNLALSTDPGLQITAQVVRPNSTIIATFNSADGENFQLDCIAGGQTLYLHLQLSSGSGSYVVNASMVNTVLGDVEPNNSLATAIQTLAPGNVINGALGFVTNSTSDNNDYFLLHVPSNGNISIQIDAPEAMQTRLFLTRTNGSSLVSTGSPGFFGAHSIEFDCLGAATYVVRVQLISTQVCGEYTLELSLDSPTEAIDQEPNNSVGQTPQTLSVGNGITGHVGYTTDGSPDLSDHYLIEVEQNGTVHLSIDASVALTSRLHLLRSNGTSINATLNEGVAGSHTLSTSCVGAGNYVVRVQSVSGCSGYSLAVAVDEPPLTEDLEPNNGLALVQETIEELEFTSGHLGHVFNGVTDGQDFFHINVDRNGTVAINANAGDGLTARLVVSRTNGSVLFSSPAVGFTGAESFELPCFGEGTYAVQMVQVSGCGSYELTYEIIDPEFENDVEPNGSIALSNETLIEGAVQQGHLGHVADGIADTDDFYILEKDRNGDLTLNVNASNDMLVRVFVYAPNGSTILSSPSEGAANISLDLTCRGVETQYINVRRVAGCGSYTLSYELTDPVFNADPEPNNSIADAEIVAAGALIEGHLGYNSFGTGIDNIDNFRFTIVEAPFEFEAAAVVADGLTARMWLLQSNGSVLASTNSAGFNDEETLSFTILNPGDYIFRLTQVSDCGSYRVNGLCGVLPTATIEVIGSAQYCPNNEPSLLANADQFSYSWQQNGTVVGNEQNLSSAPSGVYNLVTGDANGCLSLAAVVETELILILGDFNADGVVNTADLLELLGGFGCMANCEVDLDGDGMVTSADLLIFLTVFGTVCSVQG